MSDKALIIMEACLLLKNNLKVNALNVINDKYKFTFVKNKKRSYTDRQKNANIS